jgi:hypothetical protein
MNSLQNVCNLVGKVVNIPQILEHSVEAVSWDITLGAAGTALGQMFLSKYLLFSITKKANIEGLY